MRGGAVAARRAHNPKVGGSNPPPATPEQPQANQPAVFVFIAEGARFGPGDFRLERDSDIYNNRWHSKFESQENE